MGKVLKLMSDYGCFPLWEYHDGELISNRNPYDMPLTEDVQLALCNWAAAYNQTLNQEYPPDSGFSSPNKESAFEHEGRRLWRELQTQLAPEYQVVYYSNREARCT